jgi:hypothetical protein
MKVRKKRKTNPFGLLDGAGDFSAPLIFVSLENPGNAPEPYFYQPP